ncbi:MAG: triose-phosphate isomerase [Elusimicrobiota bacterium]|jgi:triosephosphate isomerase|nr:triose-phosphate isomerase [Elusimicrobiota bacterium]
MNKTISEAEDLAGALKQSVADAKDIEVLICPPFISLAVVNNVIKGSNLKLGAQNLFWENKGAFTGEVCAPMLKDAGCSFVLVGHSERRQYFGETDETVNKKVKAAFANALIPIVCVGETLQEREKNITFAVIEKQIKEGLAGLKDDCSKIIVIAYEPVWAIGTGKTATPQQAQEVHAFIRKIYDGMYKGAGKDIRILYGGSVKPDNISTLMSQLDIDGGLVGGASLDADSFTKLVKYQK